MSSARGPDRSRTGKGGPSPDIRRFRAKGDGVGFDRPAAFEPGSDFVYLSYASVKARSAAVLLGSPR